MILGLYDYKSVEILYQWGFFTRMSTRSIDLSFPLTLETSSWQAGSVRHHNGKNWYSGAHSSHPGIDLAFFGTVLHVSMHVYGSCLPIHPPSLGHNVNYTAPEIVSTPFVFLLLPCRTPSHFTVSFQDTHLFVRLKAGLIWCQFPDQQRLQVFLHQSLITVKCYKGILQINTQINGIRKVYC